MNIHIHVQHLNSNWTYKVCHNLCEIPNERDHRKIATDRNGNVYAAGFNTKTIRRLHSNGTVDRVVLNEGDGVKEPLAICFNKSCDKCYMTNCNSRVVHVYSQNDL
jgi:hypothetical protein